MIRKAVLTVLPLVLILGFLFSAGTASIRASEPAPDFTLLDLSGEQFSLSDTKGKPVILFFWTTWCPYCRKELGILNDMHAGLSGRGIELYAINAGESSGRVSKFLESRPVSYRMLLDTETEVAHAFGVLGVPTYILIDKEGRIVLIDNQFPLGEYERLLLK